MSQKRIERPQEKQPRPQDDGPKTDLDIDIGNEETDAILTELDIMQHPEKYTIEQRECGCLRPAKKTGFR